MTPLILRLEAGLEFHLEGNAFHQRVNHLFTVTHTGEDHAMLPSLCSTRR